MVFTVPGNRVFVGSTIKSWSVVLSVTGDSVVVTMRSLSLIVITVSIVITLNDSSSWACVVVADESLRDTAESPEVKLKS